MHGSSKNQSQIFLNSPFQVRRKSPKHSEFIRNFSADSLLSPCMPAAIPTTWPPSLKILTLLLYTYGLRISEALRLAYSDVNPDGLILLRASKGSRDRIIYFPQILILCGQPQHFSQAKIFPITYRAYYSHLRRAGLSFRSRPGKAYDSVTHIFRVNRFNLVQREFQPTREILQSFTGHRSARSLAFYLNSSLDKLQTTNQPIKEK